MCSCRKLHDHAISSQPSSIHHSLFAVKTKHNSKKILIEIQTKENNSYWGDSVVVVLWVTIEGCLWLWVEFMVESEKVIMRNSIWKVKKWLCVKVIMSGVYNYLKKCYHVTRVPSPTLVFFSFFSWFFTGGLNHWFN